MKNPPPDFVARINLLNKVIQNEIRCAKDLLEKTDDPYFTGQKATMERFEQFFTVLFGEFIE